MWSIMCRNNFYPKIIDIFKYDFMTGVEINPRHVDGMSIY